MMAGVEAKNVTVESAAFVPNATTCFHEKWRKLLVA